MSVFRNPSDFMAADSSLFTPELQPSSETIAAQQTVFVEHPLWPGDIQPAPQDVSAQEVEEAFASAVTLQVRATTGQDGQDEGIYLKLGQTQAGRLLAILFAYRGTRNAWILSARTMAPQECHYYCQKINYYQKINN